METWRELYGLAMRLGRPHRGGGWRSSVALAAVEALPLGQDGQATDR